jgi:Kef-type K+ transport system membrane component KefB
MMSEFLSQISHEFKLPLTNPIPIFSLILIIILISPVLLRKIRIPGIIGLIISGVIIGPFGLNLLEKNLAIDLFSTIGLLYIMFMAGLDLDMNEFIANRNKSLLFGVFTFIIPFGMGFPVAYYLFAYDFNSSLLIASLFSTHTLVAYPIVSKYGISKNQAVAITVGGTIFTDTAVLLLLAVVIGSNDGTLDGRFWMNMGISVTIFTLIMFYFIPKLARWFFRNFENEKHAHYIFVLLVVFFAAFLSELAGLEPIIGAFMAGLALNRQIPHSSALMNRVEFIGNSLFIPFFLISVGMVVDIRVLFKGFASLSIIGVLLLIALSSKWFAALFTQWAFRYSKTERNLIFGLSSSHAAAVLAVILVGFKAGLLDENILNGTIVLILVSCIVASFVTEKAARALVIQTDNYAHKPPATHLVQNEHILVPVANITSLNKLIDFALLIKDIRSANPISILSIVPNDNDTEKNIIRARNQLQEFVIQGAATESKMNVIVTIDHDTADGIARISREIMSDIVILGWPGKAGLIDKSTGERIDSIINRVEKNLFISCFNNPLIVHSKIVLFTPPHAEKEFGFPVCMDKIIRMAFELSISIHHYGEAKTNENIRLYIKKSNYSPALVFNPFNDWDNFFALSEKIQQNDLLILISARKGYISYLHILENLPGKIEKQYNKNSKMVIYPQHRLYDVFGD